MDKQATIQSWKWSGENYIPCDSIPLSDRGFRYGMSLFETVLIRNGKPRFFEAHQRRLKSGCETLDFPFPEEAVKNTKTFITDTIHHGVARIYISGGEGVLGTPPVTPQVFVLIESREPLSHPSFEQGYSVVTADTPHTPFYGGLKTANYWHNLLALNAAVKKDFNEALLFSNAGELISACMANVFVLHDEKIKTPGLHTHARAGVVREWLILQRCVEETVITHETLLEADEIFLTNSWLGIMPVTQLNDHIVPNKSVSLLLKQEYDDFLV